jgi:hypothetical protein
MTVPKPCPTYADARALYRDKLRAWAPTIEHVADPFLRMPGTDDAELAGNRLLRGQGSSAES